MDFEFWNSNIGVAIADKGLIGMVILILGLWFKAKLADISNLKASQKNLENKFIEMNMDVTHRQKYQYFNPLKHWARELNGRLWHIHLRLDQRLSPTEKKLKADNQLPENHCEIKRTKMIGHFRNKLFPIDDPQWYFGKDNAANNNQNQNDPGGGYFITSTIYLLLVMLYYLYKVQLEYPYMPLLRKKDLTQKEKDRFLSAARTFHKEYKEEIDVHEFVKDIKHCISGEDGIPYGMLDFLGDSVHDRTHNRILNYGEFCARLRDTELRVSYGPVFKFWKNIGETNENVYNARLKKTQRLKKLLSIFDLYEIGGNKSESTN